MTYHTYEPGNWWVWCQNKTLDEQLLMGIRFLDIRCRHFNNALPLHHEKYFLGIYLDQVLDKIVGFLSQHPGEMIIVNIQEEHWEEGGNAHGRSFEEEVRRYLTKVENYVYKFTGKSPTLRDARGKMIAMSNITNISAPFLPWSACSVSNQWENITFDEKWSGMKRNMDRARSASENNEWILTFSSYAHAWQDTCMNPKLYQYACSTKGRMGIVAMDYPGPQLIQDIIDHN